MRPTATRRGALMMSAGVIAGALLGVRPAAAWSADEADLIWSELATEFFGDRPIGTGGNLITLEAPGRAQDPGSVPVKLTMRLPPGDTRRIERISLLVDENPVPLAAVFHLGEKAAIDRIETRIRVNRYSRVHAVAELDDGSLHMAEGFVKASGGCSARPVERPEVAIEHLGNMDLAQLPGAAGGSARREAEIRVRHPNYTGMQMHYITLLYINARYVDELSLTQGDASIIKVVGGISLSEDPSVRVSYRAPSDAPELTVQMVDTDGARFSESWPVALTGGS